MNAMATTLPETTLALLETVNISGPFCDAGRITPLPSNDFLGAIRDPILTRLHVPEYLIRVFRNDQYECPLVFYLYMALTRHFSCYKIYAMHYHNTRISLSNMTLQDLYEGFRTSFAEAIYTLLHDNIIGDENLEKLIEQERLLTHETFSRFDELIVKAIAANVKLLDALNNISTEDRLKLAKYPDILLARVQMRLRDEWISLGDAKDIMDGRSERYHRWEKLKEEKSRLDVWCRELREEVNGRWDEWKKQYAVAKAGFRIWIDPRDREGADAAEDTGVSMLNGGGVMREMPFSSIDQENLLAEGGSERARL